ncbi:hypothetical protein ACS0TY_026399 [Phlomoides rotata]
MEMCEAGPVSFQKSVDPSIRAEVWEFLLGCYSLSSTDEYQEQLRTARRKRYRDLLKECQTMHSSIGTGSVAYVVGSKVMDMRMSSKEDGKRDAEVLSTRASKGSINKKDDNYAIDTNCTDKSITSRKESSSDYGDLVCVRGSTMGGAYDSSELLPSADLYKCSSPTAHGTNESNYVSGSYLDFPALPVTDLCEDNNKEREVVTSRKEKSCCRVKRFSSNDLSLYAKSETIPPDMHESPRSSNLDYDAEMHEIRILDAPVAPSKCATAPGSSSEDGVSEWLWTLHRIVVVRIDSHLEFYEDKKILARMSDMLAVYAWLILQPDIAKVLHLFFSHCDIMFGFERYS